MQITEEVPVEVSVIRSPIDGALIIELDVDNEDAASETRLRVYLNDGPLYDGSPQRDSSAFGFIDALDEYLKRTRKQAPEDMAKSDAELRAHLERKIRNFRNQSTMKASAL